MHGWLVLSVGTNLAVHRRRLHNLNNKNSDTG
jgi:hypothetical protein